MGGAVPLFTTPPWVIGTFYAILGFLMGVLAERYTYCIVIATHQVMGVRYSRIYEMVLVGVAVSSLLTGLLVASGAVPAIDAYAHMPGAGWYTLLGSFIFGFGIMLGQGCMMGMLWKSGQGYVVNWLEILGMVVGTLIFAFPVYNGLSLRYWWHNTVPLLSIANGSPLNYVPYLIHGAIPLRVAAALIGIIFFAGIMLVVYRLRRNRLGFEGGEAWYRSPTLYGVFFGLVMIASFVFLAGRGFNYLGITTPVGLFAEYILYPFRVFIGSASMPTNWFQTVGILNPFTFFILMIISGAFVSSILRGTFSIKLPPPNTNRIAELLIAFLGGVILAIGARIAQGCSVGGFWSGLAGLSVFGLVFTVGFIPGTIAGYYTYVYLSSAASRMVRQGRSRAPTIRIRVKGYSIDEIIFGVIWGLILIGIGLEVNGYYGINAVKLTATAATQYSLVLISCGVLVILITIIINIIKRLRSAELIKQPSQLNP